MRMLWKVKWHNKVCSECWQKVLVPRNGSTASDSLREERSLQRSLWDAREVGLEEDGLGLCVICLFVCFLPHIPIIPTKQWQLTKALPRCFLREELWNTFGWVLIKPTLVSALQFISTDRHSSLILKTPVPYQNYSHLLLQFLNGKNSLVLMFLVPLQQGHHPHIQVYCLSQRELAPPRPLTASPLTGKSVRCQP